MAIKAGDKIPSATLQRKTADGIDTVSTGEFFKGRKVVVFAVPGAFTPTCSAKHLPGFVQKSAEIKAKGVAEVVCVAVNDAFVMDAWAKEQQASGKVTLLADGSAAFAKAMGLSLDLTERGMGVRSQRYSMIVDDGVVKKLNVEQGAAFEVSDAGTILSQL